MTKRKYCFFMAFIVICCLFFLKESVNAAGSDFSRKYSGEYFNEDEDDFKLKYKCKLTISMNLSYATEWDTLSVSLINDDYDEDDWEDNYVPTEETVFDKTISGNTSYSKTLTLPAGNYSIFVEYNEDEDDYDDEYADIEDEINHQYSVTLSGEYIPAFSEKNITLQEGSSKKLKLKAPNDGTITWKSSKPSVASVANGVVKAKKPEKQL